MDSFSTKPQDLGSSSRELTLNAVSGPTMLHFDEGVQFLHMEVFAFLVKGTSEQ